MRLRVCGLEYHLISVIKGWLQAERSFWPTVRKRKLRVDLQHRSNLFSPCLRFLWKLLQKRSAKRSRYRVRKARSFLVKVGQWAWRLIKLLPSFHTFHEPLAYWRMPSMCAISIQFHTICMSQYYIVVSGNYTYTISHSWQSCSRKWQYYIGET